MRLKRRSLCGRVLPATALARGTAVPRTAGIQYPVAVGSVRLGNERSPRPAITDGRHGWIDARRASPLMMQFRRSTIGKLSRPLPFHCPAQHIKSRSATHRGGVSPGSARIYRQRDSTRRSPDKPHECWVLRPEFTVNLEIGLTANSSRELDVTLLPSD